MRENPKLEYGDDWDFQEFLEVIETTLLVSLSTLCMAKWSRCPCRSDGMIVLSRTRSG